MGFNLHKAEQSVHCTELQEREQDENEKNTGTIIRNIPRYGLPINSRFTGIKFIGQRTIFSWQRIPKFTCARKKTIEIENITIRKKEI